MRATRLQVSILIALLAGCGSGGGAGPQGASPSAPATGGEGVSDRSAGPQTGERAASGEADASGTGAPDAQPGGAATGEPSGAEAAGDAPPPPMRPLLEAHNRMRAQHCAPPLSWSAEIAHTAQRWADRLARRGCSLQHSREPYGENIAAGSTGALDAATVAERWYQEKAQYDFDAGGFSMQTGHFTQLVWAGSRRLGCGRASCSGRGMELWVCMYDPPGNMRGEYASNVRPASCEG